MGESSEQGELTPYWSSFWAMCPLLVVIVLTPFFTLLSVLDHACQEGGRLTWYENVVFLFGAVVFYLVLASVANVFLRIEIGTTGIRGRDFLGRRRLVSWDSIRSTKCANLGGWRYVRLFTDGGARPLWIPLFLRKPAAFKASVQSLAPEDNVLLIFLKQSDSLKASPTRKFWAKWWLVIGLVASLLGVPKAIAMYDIWAFRKEPPKLHIPMGTTVTIEGVVFESQAKGYESGLNVRVHRINGVAVQKIIRLPLRHASMWTDPVKDVLPGQEYEFKGSEIGIWVGATAEWLDQHRTWQTCLRYLSHWFSVSSVRPIVSYKPAPGDFVGRRALIEGTAQSVAGQGWLTGHQWRILVDPKTTWPANWEGKFVAAYGTVGCDGRNGEYTMDGNFRSLVNLDEQLGMDVQLRCRARGHGGSWSKEKWGYCLYRGTNIYVDALNENSPGIDGCQGTGTFTKLGDGNSYEVAPWKR